MMTRLGVALFWLLHWLPLPVLARMGEALGLLIYVFALPRRRVAATNLRLCFPEMDAHARNRLLRLHFRMLGRSLLERGLSWWASEARLRRLIRLTGLERVAAAKAEGQAVILLAPHFVGLDIAGTRLAMEGDFVSMYAHQKNKVLDRWLYHGRSRFNDQMLLSRQDGVRSTVKAMRAGRPFFYLPDMDYGRKDAIFVPFFGVPAATITGLSRLARLAGAVVMPCTAHVRRDGSGYDVEIGEAWADFPTADVEADTLRMNRWLEGAVKSMPEQYYWVHRRFKTRPPGEPKLY